MTSTPLEPSQMVATDRYIAKLLLKLSTFIPGYSLDIKKPEILKAWVDDLVFYGLSVNDFDRAFVKIRDTMKTFPSLAEFKETLGVTLTDASAIETLTGQIWDHLRHGSALSIDSSDLLKIIGGKDKLSYLDLESESGWYALKAQVKSRMSSLSGVDPKRLQKKATAIAPHSSEKARLDLIFSQTTGVTWDVGPIGYDADGNLDHEEFHARVNAQKSPWMPDEWWLEIRSRIIDASVPDWQNTKVTAHDFKMLRRKMRGLPCGQQLTS